MTINPDTEEQREKIRHVRHRGKHGLMAPILLVTVGVMFLVGQFVPDWGVAQTWPVLLIVVGLIKLLESLWAGRSTPPN